MVKNLTFISKQATLKKKKISA